MQPLLPIYLDHAATTPVAPEVLEEMLPYFNAQFANPASIYSIGSEARAAVETARERIADSVGAQPDEVYFTCGGTESNNWALKGMVCASKLERPRLLTSQIEHSSILEPCESLRAAGVDVEYVPVDSEGLIDPEMINHRIRASTCLVSIMTANNEVGSIQAISRIGAICRSHEIPFHTDAVQALGKLDIEMRRSDTDLMSISAHKVYGPKGVGALIIRRGVRISPLLYGGEQERGRRAGTLNVPGIVGFGSAVRYAESTRQEETRRITELRNRLVNGIESSVAGAELSGPKITAPESSISNSAQENPSDSSSAPTRLSNNAHFCFDGLEGESLLLSLDMAGICASAGSACSAGSTEPSHVLLAMGFSVDRARGAVRLTLGRSTTQKEVDYVVERVGNAVNCLRALSDRVEMI